MAREKRTAQKIRGKAPRIVKILAPTDFSPGAEPARRWAIGVGNAYGAEVIILHVLDMSVAAFAGMPSEWATVAAMSRLIDKARAEAKTQMARLARRHSSVRTMIREGSPRPTILQVAAKEGADLIVMGTHGRSGVSRVLFGSVAEHVVRHSRIPVLTIRRK